MLHLRYFDYLCIRNVFYAAYGLYLGQAFP